eukprot:gene8093-10298_t
MGRCPIGCGSKKARYTLSAKSLTVGTCNSCNCQVFARSDRSDERLRANIIPDTAPDDDAPTVPPGPIAKPDDVAPPPAAPVAADPPPKPKYAWGLLAGLE